ncbi:MAG TPA: nucleotidyltransferase family protein [Thauera sp.]|uniref:nucleotidyltransferase family protein n=1 Tax=Thauera sp. TaxID=1905334 RepID=UPI00262E83E7|nr:nucleotidyltransferase family protein [Thauera sp.]MCP5225833.1 nucleotidyltransferase family protein [Thauera sp.]HRV76661.1 nucleotidyltransferase family protein [Thauera sp.]
MPARTRGLIVGILLAAGAGSRFGGGKLLARLADDRGVAETACARLLPAVDRVVAVVPAQPGALEDALRAAGAEVVRCDTEAPGMGVSIACGVSASADAAGWLVALGDMPLVPTSQHRVVADALRAGADIAAPVCQGRRGHPVGFAARFGDELRALDGDEGARAVLARHREALLELAVDDDAGWQDIDTPSDLAAVNRRLGRP